MLTASIAEEARAGFVRSVDVDAASRVYVTAEGVNVFKFDPLSGLIASWDGEGSGDGEFDVACGVAVDQAAPPAPGRVYVADSANHRIQVFKPA